MDSKRSGSGINQQNHSSNCWDVALIRLGRGLKAGCYRYHWLKQALGVRNMIILQHGGARVWNQRYLIAAGLKYLNSWARCTLSSPEIWVSPEDTFTASWYSGRGVRLCNRTCRYLAHPFNYSLIAVNGIHASLNFNIAFNRSTDVLNAAHGEASHRLQIFFSQRAEGESLR